MQSVLALAMCICSEQHMLSLSDPIPSVQLRTTGCVQTIVFVPWDLFLARDDELVRILHTVIDHKYHPFVREWIYIAVGIIPAFIYDELQRNKC